MLILTRNKGEEIKIGDEVTIKILAVKGAQVRIGLTAPADVQILRADFAEDAYNDAQLEALEKTDANIRQPWLNRSKK